MGKNPKQGAGKVGSVMIRKTWSCKEDENRSLKIGRGSWSVSKQGSDVVRFVLQKMNSGIGM